jgi:hypothetical protein
VEWDSDALVKIADSLQKNTTDANMGSLKGNRNFYDNDYMASYMLWPATVYPFNVAHSRYNVAPDMSQRSKCTPRGQQIQNASICKMQVDNL